MKIRNTLLMLGAALTLASCSDRTAVQKVNGSANLTVAEAGVVAGEYIVVFKDGAFADLSAQSSGSLVSALGLNPQGITIQSMYSQVLSGFAAKLSDANLAKLRQDNRVKSIEPNFIMEAVGTQKNPDWGLDRIDQVFLPLDNSYTYPRNAGSGVKAYVFDTGINVDHNDFGGRAYWGKNFTSDGKDYDCQGHGTHVAGTIGSDTWGVAKSVDLYAVKVLGCKGKGANSNVIDGLEWVAKQSGKRVVNMSLGPTEPSVSDALDSAIAKLVKKGVVVVVAAGNQRKSTRLPDDACKYSPARETSAITVAASNKYDEFSSFSKFGKCTDIIAPGEDIKSVWHTSNRATKTISGTSMATPHVAGAVAVLLSQGKSAYSMKSTLTSLAIPDTISNTRGSPNLLLNIYGDSNKPDKPDNSDKPKPDKPDKPIEEPVPSGSIVYTGNISKRIDAYVPKEGFTINSSTTITGKLSGPDSADFDLYLEKKSGSYWFNVRRSSNLDSSQESISYNASSGTYRWRIRAWDGSGDAKLIQTPRGANQ